MRAVVAALLSVVVSACSLHGADSAAGPLADARQLVVVTSESWEATTGSLTRYERASITDSWQRAGETVPVMLGRNGLAWGRGLHAAVNSEPQKREGDGKAPAGVFAFGSAFGFAPQLPSRLPYLAIVPDTECVDDASAPQYNSIVNRSDVAAPRWTSSEVMRNVPEYRVGLVVLHNVPATPGAGSCIFMHLKRGGDSPTAGCTAMDDAPLRDLLQWLNPDLSPRLVQLPKQEYDARRGTWRLP